MKDSLGVYYFPLVHERTLRVYVRRGSEGTMEFRLWRQDAPEIWEKHGWLPMSAVREAAALYARERGNGGADHMRLYDEKVAQALLAEDEA